MTELQKMKPVNIFSLKIQEINHSSAACFHELFECCLVNIYYVSIDVLVTTLLPLRKAWKMIAFLY